MQTLSTNAVSVSLVPGGGLAEQRDDRHSHKIASESDNFCLLILPGIFVPAFQVFTLGHKSRTSGHKIICSTVAPDLTGKNSEDSVKLLTKT